MMSCVITRYHSMFGCDLHATQIAFPAGIPLPVDIHFVDAVVQTLVWRDAEPQVAPSIQTPVGEPLRKIFDIGKFIPHIGFNHWFLLLLLWGTSSSQAHFGVSSVQIKTNDGHGPIAVARHLFINPQLNCDDIWFVPVPARTGAVLAPNTVVAGLTRGDIAAGMLSMKWVTVATIVVGIIGARVVRFLGGKAFNLVNRLALRLPFQYYAIYFRGLMTVGLLDALFGKYSDEIIDAAIEQKINDSLNLTDLFQKCSEEAGAKIDAEDANLHGAHDYFNESSIPLFPSTFGNLPPLGPTGETVFPTSWLQASQPPSTSAADSPESIHFVEQHLFGGMTY